MDLSNSVAVVTGGADGIGLAAARRLQTLGADVMIADIDSAKVSEKAKAYGFRGVVCDVRDEQDILNLANKANELGEVRFVMPNAGVAVGGRFERIPTEEWRRLFDVNVLGVVRTINAFLPGMMERKHGHIVVTGSSAGLFLSDGFDVPYAASKHALRAITQGLSAYCHPLDIAVHYLAPRITDTAFPRSSIAWGQRGSRVTEDRDIGDDYDTVEDVVDALFLGIENGESVISLSADTQERMKAEVAMLME